MNWHKIYQIGHTLIWNQSLLFFTNLTVLCVGNFCPLKNALVRGTVNDHKPKINSGFYGYFSK